jgi:dTDP-glucose pyrophosphorylase
MMVVIPMAGRGSRYATQGYETPKPLISVAGKPMIIWALKSVEGLDVSRYIFVALKEHENKFRITELLTKQIERESNFVFLKDVTEGQLCTVLAAKGLLNRDEDILIASSDTLVYGDLAQDIVSTPWDGIISVANLPGDQWSFARTNEVGQVVEVAEKRRISNYASTGLYYFKRAGDLIDIGEQMIRDNERTRGEFYVIPVYQKMIKTGKQIGISKAQQMWDMGTPEAKRRFEEKFGTTS